MRRVADLASRNSGGFCRHEGAMRSVVPIVIVLAAALAGCESRVAGSLLYMTPYGLDDFDCDTLKRRAVAAGGRLKQVEALRDRAGASAAGPVINATVYGPDYSRAVWEVRLYQDEMVRKNCDALPAVAQPGAVDVPAPAQVGGGTPGNQWPSSQPQSDPWAGQSGNQLPGQQQPGSPWPGSR
jgi:hypothetical protein